ncbi:MAG: hypothetical protein OHK0039_12500 [Bacteroidia bacterium]
MRFQFIGTGGAFDFEYGNAAVWVTFHGQHILLDCGSTVYPRLRAKGLIDQIDYVLITHCHDDHIGSLSTTILHQTYNRQQPRKPVILYPSVSFRDILYNYLSFSIPHPEDFVTLEPLSLLPGIEAIDTYGLHVPEMPSFGYCFEDDQEIVLYSGDLGDPRPIFHLANQKSHLGKPFRIFHEMSFEKSNGVHTYYQDLYPWAGTYPIYGYHLRPADAPADNRIPLVIQQADLLL